MKVEFHLDGPNTRKWWANALLAYDAAADADYALWAERHKAEFGDGAAREAEATTFAAEPEPAKEPAKRTRKAKEEPAPQITTNPEDRKPVEEIAEAEVVEETVNVFEEEPTPAPKVYTRDDVKDAMQVYVAKHGMDKLAANAATLLGAPKLSAIPEDAAAFEAAVKRLEAAVA